MLQPVRPDDQTIRQSLDSVLSSALFSRSERLRAFLAYVVDRELEGSGDHLKGYTIGIDVFGRPQSFNADSDPLVRVHAGKLRKLLAAYYAGEGAADAWRIEIPKGTYIPEYRRHCVLQPAPTKEGDRLIAPLRAERHRISWLPAPLSSPLAVLSVLPLFIFVPLSSPALSVNIPVQARWHGAVMERKFADDLPNVAVRSEEPRDGMTARFADALRNAASHYRTIAAAPRAVRAQGSNVATDHPLTFSISVSRQTSPAGIRIRILNDASSDALHDGFIADAQLVNEADILYESLSLAQKALSADGHIFRYARRVAIDSPLMKCMALTDAYRHQQTREAFQEAKSCQEKLSADHRQKLKFVISASALPSTLIR